MALTCDLCLDQNFLDDRSLQRHKDALHALHCYECGQDCQTEHGFIWHKQSKHSPGLQCPMCDRVCRNEQGLQLHQQSQHSQNKEYTTEGTRSRSAEDTFSCTLCPEAAWKTKKQLRKHQRKVHGAECRICGKVLKHDVGLASHSEAKHGRLSVEKEEAKSCGVSVMFPSPQSNEVCDESGEDLTGVSLSKCADKIKLPSELEYEAGNASDNGDRCLPDGHLESQLLPEHSVSGTIFGDKCSDGGEQTHVQGCLSAPQVSNINLDVTSFMRTNASPNSSGAGSELTTPRLSSTSMLSYSDLAPSPSVSSASAWSEITLQDQSRAGAQIGVHCRICQKDPSEDLTTTICGHLFCKSCITEEIIARSACPVCKQAVLLYCLFRIDLSA